MRILIPTLHVRHSAQAIPLAAACLKAALPAELRRTTQLLDLFPDQDSEQLYAAIMAQAPQVVAFPLYLWNRKKLLEISRKLRQRQPDLLLLAGGPEASADSRAVLAEGALDGVIRGEGEEVLPRVLTSWAAGSTEDLPGYLSAADSARDCPAACCPELAQLPSPWLQGDLIPEPGGGVLWEVARGCPFDCAFCYDAKGQQGVRPIPFTRLQLELELFRRAGVAQVWVLDSTFNAPKQRGKLLLQLLIEEAPEIHYHFEAKADFLDAETAELLSQLSCSVQIGLQSANPAVLKPLRRSFKPPQMETALQQLAAAGVTYGLDLIYGLPHDDHAGFCQSLDFALRQQPNQVDIFPLAVLPGTTLYRQQEEYGISADPQPPYLVSSNRSYPPEQLCSSQQLAAATDIFYNRGRAVGFFLQLCQALQTPAHQLLDDFGHWLLQQPGTEAAQLLDVESWQPEQILPLQHDFLNAQFRAKRLGNLLPLVEDLLNYHFCCAEALLADDCQPATQRPSRSQIMRQRWRLNPAVKVQGFHHDLEELETFGGLELKRLAKQLHAEQSYGIFFRQQRGPVIEALQEGFARLLLSADGRRETASLLGGLPQAEARELLEFAIMEGLLLAAT